MTDSEIRSYKHNHIVARSHYKMKCFCCGENIERGDLITRCEESKGMELRAISLTDGPSYIMSTGARWVHLHCDVAPCWTAWLAYNYNDNITSE